MTVLWIICGLLAAALVIATVRLVRVKGDIRQLGKKLDTIIQTDTNAQLSTGTFDKDIAALAKSANALLAKSRRDLTTAQRTEADLKRAITNISHDLRTPLTSAKGYLQMLEEEAPNRYLSIIHGRLDTLAALMDNLFAFSQALEGNMSIEPVNIGNILRDVISNSYLELESKGFAIETAIPDIPVFCLCDEDALRRVLQNLIKNAYVHGRDYFRAGLNDNIIEIANKADGLEDIDVSRIFDRFYTADAARTHKRTGLGLAIAKELVEKMKGSMSAQLSEGMLIVQIRLQKGRAPCQTNL